MTERARGSGSGAPLALAYLTFLAALGAYGPCLSTYLEEKRHLTPSDAAYLLAVFPVVVTLATPAWTFVADRVGSVAKVLRVVVVGSLVSFAVLLAPSAGLPVVAGALLVFAAFRAPGCALLDVLALDWSAHNGGKYGRLRAFGTAGYALGAVGTSVAMRRFGPGTMVATTTAFLVVAAIVTAFLPKEAPTSDVATKKEPASLLPAFRVLARRPRFVLFLATSALHQVGLAPYDSLFPAHLARLSNGDYAGAAIGLGNLSEAFVMANAHHLVRRLGIPRTLALAYAGSAARWAIVATSRDPLVLTAAQALHGLTYGAFYAAGVAFVDAEAPPELRASAQGIFWTVTYGVAASGALALAGALERVGGMGWVFGAATAASVVGAILAPFLGRGARSVPPRQGS